MTKEELSDALSELVWEAWAAGMRAANAPDRIANDLHHEIWTKFMELDQRVLTFGE